MGFGASIAQILAMMSPDIGEGFGTVEVVAAGHWKLFTP
jgi:hypothetical protein